MLEIEVSHTWADTLGGMHHINHVGMHTYNCTKEGQTETPEQTILSYTLSSWLA